MQNSKKSRRFSLEDRQTLELLLKQKQKIKDIALFLNCDRTSIPRERRRCKGEYNAIQAHNATCHGKHDIDMGIIGRKFGMLTILEYKGIKNHRTWWRALCDCGNETMICRKQTGDRPNKNFNCGCLGRRKSQKKDVELEESLLSRLTQMKKKIEIVDGCWLWRGYCGKHGTPMTSWNCVVISCRRMIYKIFNQESDDLPPVYAGCGERLCVNPEHLKLGQPPRGIYGA